MIIFSLFSRNRHVPHPSQTERPVHPKAKEEANDERVRVRDGAHARRPVSVPPRDESGRIGHRPESRENASKISARS